MIEMLIATMLFALVVLIAVVIYKLVRGDE
jgi:hypothetical protein